MKVTCSARTNDRLKFGDLKYGVLYIRYYLDTERSIGYKVAVDDLGDMFMTLENINSSDYNHVYNPTCNDTFVEYNGKLTLENE